MKPLFQSAGLLFLLALLPACQSSAVEGDSSSADRALVRSWGGLKEVLREGHSEGRVNLSDVIGPNSFALGSLTDLSGEITIADGEIHIAEVIDGDPSLGLRVRGGEDGDMATILALADVALWTDQTLPAVNSNAELEKLVLQAAADQGLDLTQPFPFRIEGTAALDVHVLNHSCPMAHPEGPKPWRFTGDAEPVVLVGFYAQGGEGTLTHFGRKTHIHVLLPERKASGHVDAVSLRSGAHLGLPDQQ